MYNDREKIRIIRKAQKARLDLRSAVLTASKDNAAAGVCVCVGGGDCPACPGPDGMKRINVAMGAEDLFEACEIGIFLRWRLRYFIVQI